MLRSLPLAGATLLAVGVLTSTVSAPALADRPGVSRASCTAAGGTFAQSGTTRTCTTTTERTERGPVVAASASEVRPTCTFHRSCVGLVEHTFTGTSQRVTTLRTVTVRSQRGTAAPTTSTTTSVVGSAVVPLSCTAAPELHPSYGPLTVEACADRGLFVA